MPKLNEQQHIELNKILGHYFGEKRINLAISYPTFDKNGEMVECLEVACSHVKSQEEFKDLLRNTLEFLEYSENNEDVEFEEINISLGKSFVN